MKVVMKKNTAALALWLILASFPAVLFAEDITFELSVDRTRAAVGEKIELGLAFKGAQNIKAPKLPDLEGFTSHYRGPSSQVSIVNGQFSSSITHIYLLIPTKPGTFTIGPFSIEYKGKNYESNEVTLHVKDATTTGSPPGASTGKRAGSPAGDTEDKNVFLVIEPQKTEIYLNETIQVTVKLFVRDTAVKNVDLPRMAHEGFSQGELEKPVQRKEIINGLSYDTVEFTTSIFPTRTGTLELGPARISCTIAEKKRRRAMGNSPFDDDFFDNFFDRYETSSIELKSKPATITVLPLPEQGKPGDYQGAVGDFDFTVDVQPREVKAGDPVTLKMALRGNGNFATLTAPYVPVKDDFKTYEPQIKQEQGAKVIEQVLLPVSEKVKEVPALSFSFFDPGRKAYRTITRGPFPLKVTASGKEDTAQIVAPPAPAVDAPPKAAKEHLGKDLAYLKDAPGALRKQGDHLYKHPLFWIGQAIPALLLAGIFIFYKRRQRLRSDVRYARRLKAPKKAKAGIATARQCLANDDTQGFYHTIFKTLQEYLGDKLHLPPGGITVAVVDEALRPRGISEEAMKKIVEIFDACDMARYARTGIDKEKMETTLIQMEELMDYMETSGI